MFQLRAQLSAVVVLVVALGLMPHPALAKENAHRARAEGAPAPLRPLEVVSGSVARVQAIVRAQQAGLTETSEIRRIAEDLFDFDDMARRMLVPRWQDSTPEEQREFVGLFTNLLERSWLTVIGKVARAKITFQGESVNGPYAQVRSLVTIGRGREISIEYHLFETGARWAVYDVVTEGTSLISSYRSQFNFILRKSSFAQLLERMRSKDLEAQR
jgi:phospholipid transport system substrate-binding protein